MKSLNALRNCQEDRDKWDGNVLCLKDLTDTYLWEGPGTELMEEVRFDRASGRPTCFARWMPGSKQM